MTLLLDIGIALAILIAAVYLYWSLNEGRVKADIVFAPLVPASLCILPTFLLFYQMRVIILGAVFGLVIVMRVGQILDKARRNQKRRGMAKHYSSQIRDHLEGYQLVWVPMYGSGLKLPDRDPFQLVMFADEKAYFELIHGQNFTRKRWEVIELAGKPREVEYPDQLVVVLVMERTGAPPVAIPFYGTRYDKHYEKGIYDKYGRMPAYSYVWSLALSNLYHRPELTIYPLARRHFRTLKNWDYSFYKRVTGNMLHKYKYFYEHLVSLPCTHLPVPQFPDEVLSYFYDEPRIDELKTSSLHPGTGSILNHFDEFAPDFIQQAAK